KLRPGAVMPAMFTSDEAGRVERHAIARYLSSLGGPVPSSRNQPSLRDRMASIRRGQQLYTLTGCVACHGSISDPPPQNQAALTFAGDLYPAPRIFPLSGLSSKTTPEK